MAYGMTNGNESKTYCPGGQAMLGQRPEFSRWVKRGVWDRLFKALANEADNEYAMIDSTIVRVHQHSAGARKKGGSKHRRSKRWIEYEDAYHR